MDDSPGNLRSGDGHRRMPSPSVQINVQSNSFGRDEAPTLKGNVMNPLLRICYVFFCSKLNTRNSRWSVC